MSRPTPVWMVAELKYCSEAVDTVHTIEEPVYYESWPNLQEFRSRYGGMTPAEYCAHTIAATRNIAATWDVVKVRLFTDKHDFIGNKNSIDVTDVVKEAYDKLYVSRRGEFLGWMP